MIYHNKYLACTLVSPLLKLVLTIGLIGNQLCPLHVLCLWSMVMPYEVTICVKFSCDMQLIWDYTRLFYRQ